MGRNQPVSRVRNPIWFLASVCLLTIAVLAWMGWSIYDSHRIANLTEQQKEKIAVLRARILHLDEILTMSARMGAATGDLRWEGRYRTFEPELDAAIKEAVAIGNSRGHDAIHRAALTDAANAVLVEMENRAFGLVHAGRLNEARAILSSGAYEEQKKIYVQGMTELDSHLKQISVAASQSRKNRTVLLMAAVVLALFITAGAWLLILRMIMKWQARLMESNGRLVTQGKELIDLNATLDQRVKDQTRALREAKWSADSSNHAKSEFLANMSHEIRTPMTAILGFAEIMLNADQIKSEKLNCIHTIRRNGEYLLGLINDILDLSKIEAGKMVVEREDCQPCRIIAEVASLMRIRADAKGLPFNIEYIGAIPETISSDPTRLRQILINLVGNAIKFTESGSVRLVTRFADDGDEPCLHFDVIDTGLGMTEEVSATLFQPFMQGDTSTTREIGGTGLGLTISKRLAELLGGNIVLVATEKGVGSTFRAIVPAGVLDGVSMLEDPLSETVIADAANAVARVSHPGLQGCRILLAEDGPDNQRLISFILKKAGAEVTVKENGKLAFDAALAARCDGNLFDVILMDMQMPVMDGYEATGQLRQEGYSGPIIALTAHAMKADRQKCINAGCNDYTTKPIDRAKLIAMIRTHISSEDALKPLQGNIPNVLISELTDEDML